MFVVNLFKKNIKDVYMNKKILTSAILMAIVAASTTTASAALATGAVLNFDTGVVSANGQILSGSYFGMDVVGDNIIKANERTALAQNNGLIIGAIQTATGSHEGVPGCINDGQACTNTGEFPGVDAAWSFFGITGMHQTLSASTLLTSSGNTATLDFSGWAWDWRGRNTDLGSGAWEGGANGVASVTCAFDCGDGDTYTLDYSATVPSSDPVFFDVRYNLHLVGTISIVAPVPVPAAVWLFGSGLVGLAGFARSRKTA